MNSKKLLSLLAGLILVTTGNAQSKNDPLPYTPGPFEPSWKSLKEGYKFPDWYRDAKFGIWAHWGPQSQAEFGDWYGRNLYIVGHKQNKYHLETFGHPSEFGFKDLCNAWKAAKFDPDALLATYKAAGAKYFVALANHHDNFDMWNSKYQPWNAVNVGPKRDIIGGWAEATAKAGLRFGVSIHASSAWTWFEVAQLSDSEGPRKGIPYDGNVTKADGVGKWWEGMDPQDLYTQYGHKISPMVLNRKEALRNPGEPPTKAYVRKYYDRVRDVVSTYKPDLVYFDDSRMPLNEFVGLRIVADIYNQNIARNSGKNEAVVNTKRLKDDQTKALVYDFEVGVPKGLLPDPWQVDACIGAWHYLKGAKYKRADQVVRALADVVSKNGNLLLSIPLRGEGTLDDQGKQVLAGVGAWLSQNGEAIYGTRPWTRFGEGPSSEADIPEIAKGGIPLYQKAPYTSKDIRFTTRGTTLYAIVMNLPADGRVTVRALASSEPAKITKVELLGFKGELRHRRTAEGLEVEMPAKPPGEIAYVLKIEGAAK